jgi:hypothetical protein
MKRNVEIEDTLQENVDSAIDDVTEALMNYLKENPDTDELPCLNNDLDYSGTIHEIIDSSVPIYTKEIDDTMYLHGHKIETAFEDAGLGSKDDDWPNGWECAAIYCYIEQQVQEWYQRNAQDIFDEWYEKRQAEIAAEEAKEAEDDSDDDDEEGTNEPS